MENIITPEMITENLGTRLIGSKVIYYPSLASTMDKAREAALGGAAEGTVVIADEQTAGRGRINRAWLSPKGSVALSLIIYPEVKNLPYLIMLASLSVLHCIKKATGLEAGIKWPNDVLINGKKVCGILVETSAQKKNKVYSLIGIGLNVNVKTPDIPEISAIATSLSYEMKLEVSRLKIIRGLLRELDRFYLTLPDAAPIFEEWRDNLVTLGREIKVTSGGSVVGGMAEAVAGDGSLMLRDREGKLTRIIAGDVSLRDSP